jgi:hypothetical protein
VRKAKTVEALEGLSMLKTGASSYFQADHHDPTDGKITPKQFPQVALQHTPLGEGKTCCDTPTAPTCNPNPAAWNVSGWHELSFQLTDPHYYVWSWTSQGVNTAATFTASATGDLDCDGLLSNYSIVGRIDSDMAVQAIGPIIVNEID